MLEQELRAYLMEQGASDFGVGRAAPGEETPGGLPFFASVVVRLSDAVVEEIDGAPTHTYFHHYRTVNALIDQLTLKAGLFLQRAGCRYIAVAASQSINRDGWSYRGRYSHKRAACLAGLGCMGRSSLFLHREYGPRVRLGTVFTDCAFDVPSGAPPVPSPCVGCGACAAACPSGAILGGPWTPSVQPGDILEAEKCSVYMKRQFGHIGRGAVCGICMRVCPAFRGRAIHGENWEFLSVFRW